MIRELSRMLGLDSLGVVALLIFVTLFTGVVVWVLFRPRTQIANWSRIPLEEEPVEPRTPGVALTQANKGSCCNCNGGCKSKSTRHDMQASTAEAQRTHSRVEQAVD